MRIESRWGLPSAWTAAKGTQASTTPRGFENLLTGSVGRLCREALSSGAFRHYLSGPAAVATAGEEIAAVYEDGRPQRALPQKPRLKSLNLGFSKLNLPMSPWF